MTLTPCLFMARNTLVFSVFCSHIIRVWGLVSFIFVRVFPQPSCNKREQASHFLFVYIHTTVVKKEFAENPIKSMHQLKLINIMEIKNLTGEDFYDCTVFFVEPGGKPSPNNAKNIGNFRMGETREVKYWTGCFCLAGYDKYGDTIYTEVTISPVFRNSHLRR